MQSVWADAEAPMPMSMPSTRPSTKPRPASAAYSFSASISEIGSGFGFDFGGGLGVVPALSFGCLVSPLAHAPRQSPREGDIDMRSVLDARALSRRLRRLGHDQAPE